MRHHSSDPHSNHTLLDANNLRGRGIDPNMVQPRERSVRCHSCPTDTWHTAGGCDRHWTPPVTAVKPTFAATRWIHAEIAAA